MYIYLIISTCELYVITKLISVDALKYIRIFHYVQLSNQWLNFTKEIKIVNSISYRITLY